MKLRLFLASILIASVVHADSKAVEGLVKKNVTGLAKLSDDEALGYSEDSIVINERGTSVDMKQHDGCVSGAVANSFYGCVQAGIDHKLGKITVGEGTKDVAWFQVPYTSILTGDIGNAEDDKPSKTQMRTGGIIVKGEIVAQMYTQLVTDKELLAGKGGKPASGAPKLKGDAKVAGVVAGWFSTGFALNAAKAGTLIASGTSTAEFKTGADATKLAASFDKLKLGATNVEAKVFADGAIGWATADVMMPRKNGKGAVEMKLAVVLVPDGTGWRWVSMQYQFPSNPVGR